jgi:hypothetical protein
MDHPLHVRSSELRSIRSSPNEHGCKGSEQDRGKQHWNERDRLLQRAGDPDPLRFGKRSYDSKSNDDPRISNRRVQGDEARRKPSRYREQQKYPREHEVGLTIEPY